MKSLFCTEGCPWKLSAGGYVSWSKNIIIKSTSKGRVSIRTEKGCWAPKELISLGASISQTR